jgi:hypothetical protein
MFAFPHTKVQLENSAFLSLHQWLQEVLEYSHVPGHAILHAGRHRHGAKAITSGQRTNLILWCRRWVSLPVLASWVPANNMTTSLHWFQEYDREWGHRLAYHWLPLCFEQFSYTYLHPLYRQIVTAIHKEGAGLALCEWLYKAMPTFLRMFFGPELMQHYFGSLHVLSEFHLWSQWYWPASYF